MPRFVWSLAVLAAKAGAYQYDQTSSRTMEPSYSPSRKTMDFTNASEARVYRPHAKNRTLVESYLRRLGALSLTPSAAKSSASEAAIPTRG